MGQKYAQGVEGRMIKGVGLGFLAGLIDVVPMLVQGLGWDANLSAFLLWVVAGFMIATSNLKIAPAIKGVVLSVFCLAPSAVLIAWKDPVSLLPISAMTLILGSLLGHFIDK